MSRFFSLCLSVFLLLTIASPSQAEDWPTWRHDRLRSGVTKEKLHLPLKPAWVFRSRQSSQAIKPTNAPHMAGFPDCIQFNLPMIAAGNSLFFSNAQDGRVVCLDTTSGKMKWEFVAGGAVNRTPMFWKEKFYVGSDDGNVYCLDASSGKIIWTFRAAPHDRHFLAYGKMISVWPVRTDVLVDKGVAYFAAGIFPHEGTFLYGVDAHTGKLLWRNGTQCENSGQLSLAPGGHLFVTGDLLPNS
jgi:glucose dehydrogenase